MDGYQGWQANNAAYQQQLAEEARREALGRAAAALALENEERARQLARDAASQRRQAEAQANLGFGYRQW